MRARARSGPGFFFFLSLVAKPGIRYGLLTASFNVQTRRTGMLAEGHVRHWLQIDVRSLVVSWREHSRHLSQKLLQEILCYTQVRRGVSSTSECVFFFSKLVGRVKPGAGGARKEDDRGVKKAAWRRQQGTLNVRS